MISHMSRNSEINKAIYHLLEPPPMPLTPQSPSSHTRLFMKLVQLGFLLHVPHSHHSLHPLVCHQKVCAPVQLNRSSGKVFCRVETLGRRESIVVRLFGKGHPPIFGCRVCGSSGRMRFRSGGYGDGETGGELCEFGVYRILRR